MVRRAGTVKDDGRAEDLESYRAKVLENSVASDHRSWRTRKILKGNGKCKANEWNRKRMLKNKKVGKREREQGRKEGRMAMGKGDEERELYRRREYNSILYTETMKQRARTMTKIGDSGGRKKRGRGSCKMKAT